MTHNYLSDKWYGTTVVSVRKGSEVVIAADGQVTLGDTVMKANARKVRSLASGKVITGFAGATADAFSLFERLEILIFIKQTIFFFLFYVYFLGPFVFF